MPLWPSTYTNVIQEVANSQDKVQKVSELFGLQEKLAGCHHGFQRSLQPGDVARELQASEVAKQQGVVVRYVHQVK